MHSPLGIKVMYNMKIEDEKEDIRDFLDLTTSAVLAYLSSFTSQFSLRLICMAHQFLILWNSGESGGGAGDARPLAKISFKIFHAVFRKN